MEETQMSLSFPTFVKKTVTLVRERARNDEAAVRVSYFPLTPIVIVIVCALAAAGAAIINRREKLQIKTGVFARRSRNELLIKAFSAGLHFE